MFNLLNQSADGGDFAILDDTHQVIDAAHVLREAVDHGVADSRSAVIRRGVHHLVDSVRRAQIGETIAASYRELPQTNEDNELAMANAIAMTEAESW